MNSDSWSGTPDSAKVGTLGKAGSRLPLVTASARNWPSLMLGAAPGRAPHIIGVWPPIVDVIAGAAPLNGTCVRSRPSDILNSSPASWPVVPVPGEAWLYLPGLA